MFSQMLISFLESHTKQKLYHIEASALVYSRGSCFFPFVYLLDTSGSEIGLCS